MSAHDFHLTPPASHSGCGAKPIAPTPPAVSLLSGSTAYFWLDIVLGSIVWEETPLLLSPRLLSIVVLFAAAVATCPTTPSEGAEARAGQTAPAPGALAAAIGELQDVTTRLVGRSASHRVAPPASRPQLLGDLRTLAVRRHQLLAELIEDHPEEVLRARLTPHDRASLPADIHDLLEEDVTAEGDLTVVHEDGPGHDRYQYFLAVAGRSFSLHFAGEPPRVLTGARVRVNAVRVDEALALGTAQPDLAVLSAAPLPATFGEQRTAVLLVTFAQNPVTPYTLSDMRQLVFGTTSDYYRENSYDQTWLAGEVYGWYTIVLSNPCSVAQISALARAEAAAAGVNLSRFTRLVYIFPRQACGWSGMGTLGGAPSESWINGNPTVHVIGHELGHNVGLYHSHALGWRQPLECATCLSAEYGDTLDIMGSAATGHFNAFQKERLGWLNFGASPPVITVESTGTYILAPYESLGSEPKALKVLQNPTTQTFFYVESRRLAGFDESLANTNVATGVAVHRGDADNGNSSYLLDLTPATASWWDPALGLGLTLHDKTSGLEITPLWIDGTSAGVQVTFAAATAPDLVMVSVSDPPATASPRGHFTVTDTVKNQGTGTAGASRVRYYLSLDTVKDAGDILLTGSRAVVSLGDGAASTGSLTLWLPAALAAGTYSLLACADGYDAVVESDESNNCTASTTAVKIGAPDLVVTAVTNPPATATRGARFVITDTVRNEGTATAAASRVRYYLSADTTKGAGDVLLTGSRSVITLAPGAQSTGSATLTVPTTATAGAYFVLACADDLAAVTETSETDNCRAAAVRVTIGP